MHSVLELTDTTLTPKYLVSYKFPLQFLCKFAGAIIEDKTRDILEYFWIVRIPKCCKKWSNAFGKDGSINSRSWSNCGRHKYTILRKMWRYSLDHRKDITYMRSWVNHIHEKADPNHCRITMGNNLIKYPGNAGTWTADMLTVRQLFNSVISPLKQK